MSKAQGSTIVIGGASPLGVCLVEHLSRWDDRDIVIIDEPAHFELIEHLAEAVRDDPVGHGRVTALAWREEKGFPYLLSHTVRDLAGPAKHIFEVGFQRDRFADNSAISRRNPALFRLALEIAGKAKNLESLVITTDVGVAGNYPGRFYETWTDVNQEPFDAVDATSLEVEKLAIQNDDLPIVRARLGVLSDPESPVLWGKHWKPTSSSVLPSLPYLRRLPRRLAVPMAIADGCRAPLTPIEWGANALRMLAENPGALGCAFHLIMWHKPSMIEVLQKLTKEAGGAQVRGGLSRSALRSLSKLPGMREMVRVRSDHLAAQWTPNRYCLSVNDLDTSRCEKVLGAGGAPPAWGAYRDFFFRYLD